MINKYNKIKAMANDAILAGTVALMSSPVFATGDSLTGVTKRGVETFNAFNHASIAFFYLSGVVIFGGGCYLLYKEQGEQGRGHAKKGAVGMLVGAALLALPTMIGLTQQSVAGDESSVGVITKLK